MKTIIEALEILKICTLPDVHSHPCEICIELHDECRGYNNCRVGQALARAREIERERQWTTITDNPATWPEEGKKVPIFGLELMGIMQRDGSKAIAWMTIGNNYVVNMLTLQGFKWQYLPEVGG